MLSDGSRELCLVPEQDETSTKEEVDMMQSSHASLFPWGAGGMVPRTGPLRMMAVATLLVLGVIGFFAFPHDGLTSIEDELDPLMLAETPTVLDHKFRIIENPDMTVAVMCKGARYLSASPKGVVTLSDGAILDWESFSLEEHGDDKISLKSHHGKYLSLDSDGKLSAGKSDVGDHEKFKRISYKDGTISLMGSGEERVNVANLEPTSGSHRKGQYAVFGKKGKPATTELFKITKGSSAGTIALKSLLHGTYMGVDENGFLTVESPKIGKMESFHLVSHKTHFKKIKVVSLKAGNGMYLSSCPNGTTKAMSSGIHGWEKFKLVPLKKGAAWIGTVHATYLSVSLQPIYTFYMYRAEQEQGRPWENVNTGNLGGVLWYIHNEVVVENPRKYAISRITRVKFQMATPPELSKRGLVFGARFAYDTGMCTGAGPINGWASCRDFYAKFGNFVGCNYLGDFPFPMTSKGFGTFYLGGIWYNLPKEGHCGEAPSGLGNCSYTYSPAGYLDISALYDVDNYWVWANNKANVEYSKETDTGVGTNFFDHLYDANANHQRVLTARRKFNEKYPDMAKEEDMKNPVCDFQCQRFYNDQELQQVGAECRCSERVVAKRFYTDVGPDECKLNSQKAVKIGYYAGKATGA